jgi:hypothetical protein
MPTSLLLAALLGMAAPCLPVLAAEPETAAPAPSAAKYVLHVDGMT